MSFIRWPMEMYSSAAAAVPVADMRFVPVLLPPILKARPVPRHPARHFIQTGVAAYFFSLAIRSSRSAVRRTLPASSRTGSLTISNVRGRL